jgi:hypothetical protein
MTSSAVTPSPVVVIITATGFDARPRQQGTGGNYNPTGLGLGAQVMRVQVEAAAHERLVLLTTRTTDLVVSGAFVSSHTAAFFQYSFQKKEARKHAFS